MATRTEWFDEEVGHSFEEEWPELARRLDRFLASKAVDASSRDDVVQETGTRLYRRWSRLDHSRPLWNLVVTIALRIVIDEYRRGSRIELVGGAPQLDADDVETRALQRVHIAKTQAALTRLSPDQRRVLLAEVGEATALEGPRNRTNVLRLRARLALRNQLGPWAPAAVALRVRSLRAALERRVAEWDRDAQAVTASMASFAMVATLVIVPPLLGHSDPLESAGPSVQTSEASLIVPNDLGKISDIPRSRVPGTDPTSSASKPSRANKTLGDHLRQDAQRLREESERLPDHAEDLARHVTRDGERVRKDGERAARDVRELGDHLP